MASTAYQQAVDRLDAKWQGDNDNKFVTLYDLKDVWNRDFLKSFFAEYGVGLTEQEVNHIRDHSLKMLSILLRIELKFPSRAEPWLIALKDQENQALWDSKLPYSELEHPFGRPPLPTLDFIIFDTLQYRYKPAEIWASLSPRKIHRREMLPIIETLDTVGQGGFGKVTKKRIAKRYFVDEAGLRNEAPQMFAVKEFREMNDGKVEVNNLQLIKQSKISHSNITMHRAIFTYLDTYHILYDVADANLKEFLEANNFDQYLRPLYRVPTFMTALYHLSDALRFLHEDLSGNLEKFICCHMDLKPENILVFMTEHKFTFKIADLGISRIKQDPHQLNPNSPHGSNDTTKTLAKRGEGEFCAPEMRGEKAMVGRAVDVWSMGCILIVAIIRAIEGAAALDQFENSKANRYRDDYFYYHNREDSSIQLKPEVTRWIGSLLANQSALFRYLICFGVGSSVAKEILLDTKKLIMDSLEIDGRKRLKSRTFAATFLTITRKTVLNQISKQMDQSTLGNSDENVTEVIKQDINQILRLVKYNGLDVYKRCYMLCQVNDEVSVESLQELIEEVFDGSLHDGVQVSSKTDIIKKACKLVRGESSLASRLDQGQTFAALFLFHVHAIKRHDILEISSFSVQTRANFKKFNVWVSCNCGTECGKKWNFIDMRGISRQEKAKAKDCKATRNSGSFQDLKNRWEAR